MMRGAPIAVFCAALTAAASYLSGHVEGAWWLAWIAPVPLLWLAFGRAHPLVVLAAALGAAALSAAGLVSPYVGIVPAAPLVAAIALSAIGFAVCVMGARFAGRSVAPAAAPLAFASLWTVWDFVAASGPDGALASPACSQALVPILIQGASLFGAWIVTFLLGAVSGFAALAFARRNSLYLLPAAGLFMVNVAYGAIHLQRVQGPERSILLIDSDALAEASAIDSRDIALGAVLAYAAEIRLVAQRGDLVVLPERIAILRPQWRAAALDYLRGVAASTGTTIVAGFETRGEGAARNVALTIAPDGAAPVTYVQSDRSAGMQAGAPAVAISHDLNFFAALRRRMARDQAGMLVVPAWDFGADSGTQSRLAILRSVESGFALARAARDGRLLLVTALGHVVAQKPTGPAGFTTLSAGLPTGPDAGRTLYDRIGDSFVWACVLLGAGLMLGGVLRLILRALPAGARRPRIAISLPVWAMARGAPRAAAAQHPLGRH